MSNNQLPADVQERIKQQAKYYASYDEDRDCKPVDKGRYYGYIAGATTEALKAQQGAAWVKPKDVHKNGILHCCRMGGRTGYIYHSVVWDSDGKRWIGGLSDETREIEVLDESGSNELVAENEQLRRWKAEALTLLSQVDAYADKHPEIKLGQSKAEFTIAQAKERDTLKERCEKMEAALKAAEKQAIEVQGNHFMLMCPNPLYLITEALKEGESNTPDPVQGEKEADNG